MVSHKINIHAVGFSVDDRLSKKAGCCVVLEYEDDYGRRSTRTITHPIGNADVERAHLQAAHLALASVTRQMRKISEVRLFCPTTVIAVLDKSDELYPEKIDNDTYADVIGEARKWITFYDSLRFESCVVDDIIGHEQAKECAESQSSLDTGTVVIS